MKEERKEKDKRKEKMEKEGKEGGRDGGRTETKDRVDWKRGREREEVMMRGKGGRE